MKAALIMMDRCRARSVLASRRGPAIAIAFLLHAAALALILTLHNEPPTAAPDRVISFVDLDAALLPASAPPQGRAPVVLSAPPPPAAPTAPAEQTAPAPPSAARQPSVPTSSVASAPAQASAPVAEAGTGSSGASTGGAEGSTGATAAGAGTGTPGAASGRQEPEYVQQYQITDVPVIPSADILSRITYPPIAARQGIEATVYLELYIDQAGIIRKVVVLKDPGYGFAEAAVRALTGAVTTPARANGRPVAVRFRYPIRFTLK